MSTVFFFKEKLHHINSQLIFHSLPCSFQGKSMLYPSTKYVLLSLNVVHFEAPCEVAAQDSHAPVPRECRAGNQWTVPSLQAGGLVGHALLEERWTVSAKTIGEVGSVFSTGGLGFEKKKKDYIYMGRHQSAPLVEQGWIRNLFWALQLSSFQPLCVCSLKCLPF